MEKTKMIQDVLKCYEQLDKCQMNGVDGYCDLANLGNRLMAYGIDYKGMGYGRLKEFANSLGIFDFYVDNTRQVPVVYVRKKDVIKTGGHVRKNTPGLFEWAFMGHYDTMIQDLARKALEEVWCLGNSKKYDILDNYLRYTFKKLWVENKICYSKDSRGSEYAAFNTGLVNDLYQPIYALFGKNSNRAAQEWYRIDFCIAGEERSGKTLVNLFADLPQPANYFSQISDLLYDVSKGHPVLDYHHIVIENLHRFPYSVLKEFAPKGVNVVQVDNLTTEERNKYFDDLRVAMQNDKDTYRGFREHIESVVKFAVERVRWNYKSAIPMYYERRKKMCLLLPLTFGRYSKDKKIELALVVSKGQSGNYQGETIYPLDWAYRCARLVCRPDSDWLSTNTIQPSQKDDNE